MNPNLTFQEALDAIDGGAKSVTVELSSDVLDRLRKYTEFKQRRRAVSDALDPDHPRSDVSPPYGEPLDRVLFAVVFLAAMDQHCEAKRLERDLDERDSMSAGKKPDTPAPTSVATLTRDQIKQRADRVAARGRT